MKSRCIAVSQCTMQYHTIYVNCTLVFVFCVSCCFFNFILTVPLSFLSYIIQDMSLHSALLFNTPTSILSGSTQQTCNEPDQSAISNKNLNICCTFFLHSILLFNTSVHSLRITSANLQYSCTSSSPCCYTFLYPLDFILCYFHGGL